MIPCGHFGSHSPQATQASPPAPCATYCERYHAPLDAFVPNTAPALYSQNVSGIATPFGQGWQ